MILASKRVLLASALVLSFACSDDEDTTTGRDPGSANNGGNASETNGANAGETNDGDSETPSNGSNGSGPGAGTNGKPGGGPDSGIDAGGSDAGQTGGTGGNDAGAEDLEDGEIAAVTSAAHVGALKQAELALLRARQAPVRELAQTMATEHGAAQARQAKLLTQLGIIPRESETSMKVTQQSGMLVGGLEVTDSEAFDLAYIDAQVTMNQMVLDLLEDRLLPSVDQASLAEELQTVRTAVQSHLRQAQELKQTLGGSADAG